MYTLMYSSFINNQKKIGQKKKKKEPERVILKDSLLLHLIS